MPSWASVSEPHTCDFNATFSLYIYMLYVIPYTREHNDRSFYLKLVAAMGRYIYGVYLFMG